MIEIKGLTKKFEDSVLFSDFNLTIQTGEFIVFSGPSGCGKTTLLNMIGAIEDVNSGEIIIDGINITNKKNHLTYFRQKVGFLFQNFALIDSKTVRENLKLVRKSCRTEVSIEESLKVVGLENKIDHKVYSLSGGEQQRVALARLLLKKCDIILADEPTGSLDNKNANVVIDHLKKLNDLGKTVILVTHDEEIKKKGKRIVELPC
ncbi:ABC transporter ATP-binding protein [Priestia koreensis]|uniref:ABC transporter ATP-binding protein n=1 Tax=Priestia koreensis TaxID=284581 RepID=UPI00203DDCFD|nr:ATP-binding cassette domain-containing protein [Priestia koreensis]MCM3006847.1 ATP-binding cassette domain-containing protein [Priestia koreensis]